MTGVADAAGLEGRLLAQRRLLVALLTRLAERDRSHFDEIVDTAPGPGDADGQEDPGAVVEPAFAIEAAAAAEIRRIRDEVLAVVAAKR